MIAIKEFINQLTQKDILITSVNGELKLKAPKGAVTPEILKSIGERKASILKFLDGQEEPQVAEQASLKIERVERLQEGAYPLSFAQKRMWFVDKLSGNTPEYNMPIALKVVGNFELEIANQAIQSIVSKHEILRAQFVENRNGPLQVINENAEFTLKLHDLTDAEDKQSIAHTLILSDQTTPFDLSADMLFRASFLLLEESEESREGILLFNTHHIISDGWSLGILVREFVSNYVSLKETGHVSGVDLDIQYIDYVEWQQKQLSDDLLNKQINYWKRQLQDLPAVHSLPNDYSNKPNNIEPQTAIKRVISESVTSRLLEMAANRGLTPFMLLHGLLSLVISRCSASHDVVVGTPTANRGSQELEALVGLFVNTLVLRVNTNFESLNEYLAAVKQINVDAMSNQDVPLETLIDELAVPRNSQHSPLFQIMFSLNNIEVGEFEIPGISFESLERDSSYSKFDLDINASVGDKTIQIAWDYDPSVFKPETVKIFADSFSFLLEEVAKIVPGENVLLSELSSYRQSLNINGSNMPDLSTADLGTADLSMTELEMNRQISSETGPDKTIYSLFEMQARANPDKTALVCEQMGSFEKNDSVESIEFVKETDAVEESDSGESSNLEQALGRTKAGTIKRQLSYRQLHQAVVQLSDELLENNISKEDIVALCMSRSTEMIVALLAIKRIGAAYLPLSSEVPVERVDEIVAQTGITFCITDDSAKSNIQISNRMSVSFSELAASQHLKLARFQPKGTLKPITDLATSLEELAYVIFTSGSTGKPKGVKISHSAFNQFLLSMKDRLGDVASQDLRLLALTTLTFDISGLEVFLPLIAGGQIVLANDRDAKEPRRVAQLVNEYDINFMQATPASWKGLVNANWTGKSDLTALCGGEALTRDLAVSLINKCLTLWNCYGPTEATVWSLVSKVNKDANAIRLSQSLSGYQHLVLDIHGQLAAPGTIGELCIAGRGLAEGYWNNKSLTDEKFISKQLGNIDNRSIRLYRTGDLVKQSGQDEYQFLGRTDDQVKIRGFRIELEEINNVILSSAIVSESAVVTKVAADGEKYLVAYITIHDEFKSNSNSETTEAEAEPGQLDDAIKVLNLDATLVSEVKQQVQSYLPFYMVPSSFVVLEHLPTTGSGKVNKTLLSSLQGDVPNSKYQAPDTALKTLIQQSWEAVLKQRKVSVTADFFGLGGHSLLAVNLTNDINSRIGVELNVRDIFDYPTIDSLSNHLVKNFAVPSDIDTTGLSQSALQSSVDLSENSPSSLDKVLQEAQQIRQLSGQIPLSFGQERMLFIDSLDGGSSQYNMPVALKVTGKLKFDLVEEAFSIIIDRHQILRTVYRQVEGEYRAVLSEQDFSLERIEAPQASQFDTPSEIPKAISKLVAELSEQVFDLSNDLMLKAYLIEIDQDKTESLLLINCHHIAADGWSLQVLLKEFIEVYQALLNNTSIGYAYSSNAEVGSVLHFNRDTQGSYWVSTATGLKKLDMENKRLIDLKASPLSSYTDFSISLPDTRILVATSNGLYFYLPRSNSYTKINSRIKQNNIEATQAALLPNEKLLLASRQGFFSFNEEQELVPYFHSEQKLFSRPISTFNISGQDLWVAFEGGELFRFDLTNHLSQKYDLSRDMSYPLNIMSIQSDNEGNIWLSSNQGIYKILLSSGTTRRFVSEDGLQSNFFNRNSGNQGNYGRLYFGGRNGLNAFYPNKIDKNNSAPKAALTEFTLFNHEVYPGLSESFSLDQPISNLSQLELSHRDLIFGFEFSALHFADSQRNQYAYMMEGLVSDWSYTDAENRRVTFTNLSPGNYVFRLKTANKDGIWSEEELKVGISIKPAPWLSWWAVSIYFIIATLLILLFIKIRTQASQNRAKELQRQVRERTNEIQLQKNVIEALLERKEQMFANISHEFRTPLTLILGPLSSLLSEVSIKRHRHQLDIIYRNAQSLLNMVQQILKLTELKQNSDLRKSSQNVTSSLKPIVDSFQSLARIKNISLSFNSATQRNVMVTNNALEIIIGNLISNAIKYTNKDGRVIVQTKDLNTQIQISVSDTGVGIKEDKQSIIFDRFERVADTSDKLGVGLGLSIVRELIKKNNGAISVKSIPNVGSEFMISLPATSIQPDNKEPPIHEIRHLIRKEDNSIASTSSQSSPQISPSQELILIIDDNQDMVSYLCDLLGDEYQCLTALDGKQGVEVAISEIPVLIICDLMMPKMNGHQVVSKLRNNINTSHIPIILLTAKDDKASRIKGWQENIDDYITKPFDTDELKARVCNLLSIRKILSRKIAFQIEEKSIADDVHYLNLRDQEFIDRIKENIASNYTNPYYSRADLASALAISERQLQRKMKALIDQNPIDLLRSYRLDRAAELLCEGQQVGVVASMCGFYSLGTFTRCFKARFELTPKAYQLDKTNRIKRPSA